MVMDTIIKFEDKAIEFARLRGFTIVRYITTENGKEIYQYTSPELLHKKLGLPLIIAIDRNGEIVEINDVELLMRYRSILSKKLVSQGNNTIGTI